MIKKLGSLKKNWKGLTIKQEHDLMKKNPAKLTLLWRNSRDNKFKCRNSLKKQRKRIEVLPEIYSNPSKLWTKWFLNIKNKRNSS